MFFKMSKIKSLMKTMYKAWGLHVGVTETGWLYVGGMSWAICQSLEECPKEFKGAIIELCGDLPEPGQAYLAQKDAIQMEMLNDFYILPSTTNVDPQDEPCELSEVRDIVFRGPTKDLRLVENIRSQSADVLDNNFVELVDPGQCGPEEDKVEGPFRQTMGIHMFVWHNGLTWYGVMPIGLHKPETDEPESSNTRLYEEAVTVAEAFGLRLNEG